MAELRMRLVHPSGYRARELIAESERPLGNNSAASCIESIQLNLTA